MAEKDSSLVRDMLGIGYEYEEIHMAERIAAMDKKQAKVEKDRKFALELEDRWCAMDDAKRQKLGYTTFEAYKQSQMCEDK